MTVAFRVQRLVGHTDGRPSWITVIRGGARTWSKESAERAADELRAQNPGGTYRVRKHTKKEPAP